MAFRAKGEVPQGMVAIITPVKNRMKTRYPSLVDLAQSDSDAEKNAVPEPAPDNRYPWGTRLNLGEAELKKLGITELPEVGEVIDLCAIAEVCCASQMSTTDGIRRHLELQITHLGVEVEEEDD